MKTQKQTSNKIEQNRIFVYHYCHWTCTTKQKVNQWLMKIVQQYKNGNKNFEMNKTKTKKESET